MKFQFVICLMLTAVRLPATCGESSFADGTERPDKQNLTTEEGPMNRTTLPFNGNTCTATLADNLSAIAFAEPPETSSCVRETG